MKFSHALLLSLLAGFATLSSHTSAQQPARQDATESTTTPLDAAETTATMNALGASATPEIALRVVNAGTASTEALNVANASLAANAELVRQASSCFQGNERGPWRFGLVLRRNGRVRRALFRPSETQQAEESASAECLRAVMESLSFEPDLGRRVEVELRRVALGGAGVGGLGLRDTGTGSGSVSGTISLGNVGAIGQGTRTGRGFQPRRAQPRVQTGGSIVQGSLDRDIIRRVIRRHINQVRYCYERVLVRKPELRGTVRVRFVISATGSVDSSSADSVPDGFEEVAQCITRSIRRWTFPAPEGGGIVVVRYPFALSPG